MRHAIFSHMLDELLEDPDEIVISSPSKRTVLYGRKDGPMEILSGDFSGTPEECEAEIRRIIKNTN